ncbi:hypothetical protein FXO37_30060 [Capsicum annuum]|nr:hypothetical protein FXO37_30060 [Capsicum annuum]
MEITLYILAEQQKSNSDLWKAASGADVQCPSSRRPTTSQRATIETSVTWSLVLFEETQRFLLKVKKNFQFGHHQQQQNHMNTTEQKTSELVTVDGERELELETLLKASAYILGASGSSIMYKVVLEDGTTLAVRRIGESGMERFTDFENR